MKVEEFEGPGRVENIDGSEICKILRVQGDLKILRVQR